MQSSLLSGSRRAAMPFLTILVWVAGAFLAVLAGFKPDPYLIHVRHLPEPHPYPINAAVAVVVLMTVHTGFLAASWRSWLQLLSWRHATVAVCVCAAFLPIGALMALHAPPPVSAYLQWLLVLAALVFLVAVWRIASAAARALQSLLGGDADTRQ